MTIEKIKEHLSNNFVGILASNRRFLLEKPAEDYGVDYQLKRTYTYVLPGGRERHSTDGRYIDIQLKATTMNSIIDEPDQIKYDLEAKSFNDLVERQKNGTAPLVLILFVLPEDINDWVNCRLPCYSASY